MFTWIRIKEISVRFYFSKFFNHFIFWTTILTVNWWKVDAVEARCPAGCRLQICRWSWQLNNSRQPSASVFGRLCKQLFDVVLTKIITNISAWHVLQSWMRTFFLSLFELKTMPLPTPLIEILICKVKWIVKRPQHQQIAAVDITLYWMAS